MNTILRGWQYDDGGRAAAGHAGTARDCVCRAIAIAAQIPYAEVYRSLEELAKQERLSPRRKSRSSARGGVYRSTFDRYLLSLGWQWVPTMRIGQGCTVHLRGDELPPGRLIVRVSRHLCAVIDGELHDTHDCSRGGTRCVYGYWHKPL